MNKGIHKKLIFISSIPLLFSIFLHLLGYNIDYYRRSFAFTFFAIGEAALICSVIYLIYKKSAKEYLLRIWNILKIFGVTAFFVYIVHYLLILKLLEQELENIQKH